MVRLAATLRSFVLAGCALAAGLGCSAAQTAASGDAQDLTAAPSRLTPRAKMLWDSYVQETISAAPLQEACVPKEFSPGAGVDYKGVVILFHGFTACPQQYFDLANTLAADGFEVLLPLLPGHGRVPQTVQTTVFGHRVGSERLKDDISDLPGTSTASRYRDVALTMNQIADAASGTKVVGGLSVGGAVAARASIEAPALYDRTLLMTPFFQATGTFLRDFVFLADHVDPSFRTSWGAGCIDERTQPVPRQGICQFTIDALQGSIQFGQETLAQVGRITNVVQIAGVEDDQAADDVAEMQAARTIPKANTCFFRKPANHSLLSKFDAPHENKFWRRSALDEAEAFITRGAPFATAEPSSQAPYARCEVVE